MGMKLPWCSAIFLTYKNALNRKGTYLESTGYEKEFRASRLPHMRPGEFACFKAYIMRGVTTILKLSIEKNLGTNSFYLDSRSSMTRETYSFRVLHQYVVVMLKEAFIKLFTVFDQLIIQCFYWVQILSGIWNITTLSRYALTQTFHVRRL